TNKAPSGAHWFGTDQLGRDVFSRVIVGARTILTISFFATVLGTLLGTALALTTCAPSEASRRAMDSPIPLLAPVTSATFPASRVILGSPLDAAVWLVL